MSSLKKLVQSKGLPPMPQLPAAISKKRSTKDYSSKPWNDYFENKKLITVGARTFQYYENGADSNGVLVVFLHGGGFSGLTWALLTKILSGLVVCRCIAPDLRGHGGTITDDDDNMAAKTLALDVCLLIEELEIDCPLVLVGHSMGGAIAIHTAMVNRLHRLAGLVVIDVVEGTALEALKSMHHVLHSRPGSFESVEKANEWCVRSGYIHNLESARVSMPGQLVRKEVSTSDVSASNTFTIAEEPDEQDEQSAARFKKTNFIRCFSQLTHCADFVANLLVQWRGIPLFFHRTASSHKYVWRIDLTRTEPFWEGWFKGMSNLFLSVPVPKLLLLAGVDRLDRELSIGQMQGKFQLQVMRKTGHVVHEDNPGEVADVIANFLVRHKLTQRK